VTIRAHWQRIPNFGDQLTPWLVERMTGKQPSYASPTVDPRPKLIAAGSILRDAMAGCVVWGAGALSMREVIRPDADYRAVRGPASRKMVLDQGGTCPEVYGDPGLLMPRYAPRQPVACRLGIIPHYVDYAMAWDAWGTDPSVRVIDVRGGVEAVLAQATGCEAIASSSLHGLVLAVAYGIPHGRLILTGKLEGDGMKFHDFYEGIGQDHVLLDCRGPVPSASDLVDRCRVVPLPDISAFEAACPVEELQRAKS